MSSPPLAGEPDGKYGPHTATVEAVIDRARRLTAQEIRALADAWTGAGIAVSYPAAEAAAWDAAYADAEAAVRDAAYAARFAAGDVGGAVGDVAGAAVGDAVLVALVADLAGKYGLTREQLETISEPWRQVITDVDPLAEMERDGDG